VTITLVYSTQRTHVDVAHEQDGRRSRLVVFVPAGMPASRILEAARPKLSAVDFAELEDALGPDKPDGVA
jgi:hypothetical protein